MINDYDASDRGYLNLKDFKTMLTQS